MQQRLIYAYDIWNEPTNPMFLNASRFGSAEWQFLAQMQYEAYAIAKTLTEKLPQTPCLRSTDPTLIGVYVLGPSLIFDGNAHMVKVAGDVLQGLVDYKRARGYNYWPVDAMTCHVYNTRRYDPTEPSNVGAATDLWGQLLDQCCATLAQYGMPHPNQPWITELGYTVDQPYPPYDGTFAYQLVQTTYDEAWNRDNRNINNVFWYSWNMQQGGILFNEANGKPSAGFQAVIDHAP